MNNNLVPQKRMDKNGRMVSRHVRVDVSQPKKPLSIPKVFAVKADMGVFGKWSDTDNIRVTKMLSQLDPENLLQLRDIMVNADERTREQLQDMVRKRSVISHITPAGTIDADLQYAALLLPILNAIYAKDGGYIINHGKVDDHVPAMLNDRVPRLILSGTESQQNLAKGYCMMFHAGFESGPDHKDTEWFGAHAEELLPHFERIRELDDLDREFCESLISSDSPSLSTGIL